MQTKSNYLKLRTKTILSPMAGITDVAFRTLARQYGAGLTFTEFVSSTALVRGSQKTEEMLTIDPTEKPVGVQLFGSNEEDVVSAGQEVSSRFDIIDINCGCPAYKVINTGAGSEMLKDPEKISRLVNKLASSVSRPVTAKIRIGIDNKHINALDVAKIVEDAGAAAIAVHGRTQKQGYQGEANWDVIRQVKEKVNIPVIGNGDVFDAETFEKRLTETGVDYIMIARGAIGNPQLFEQITQKLKGEEPIVEDRLSQFAKYLELAEKYKIRYPVIKQQALGFTKSKIGGAELRRKISVSKNINELKNILA